MDTEEEWRWIPGYEGHYDVSTRGRVRTWKTYHRQPVPRFLKHRLNVNGYPEVVLWMNNQQRKFRIHVLMLTTFIGPREEGMDGCHSDGDRENNVIENLRWDSHAANMAEVFTHGNHWQTNKTHCKNGHELSGDNIYSVEKHGYRKCVKCARASKLKSDRKRRKRLAAEREAAR